jgi:hypothetical protein
LPRELCHTRFQRAREMPVPGLPGREADVRGWIDERGEVSTKSVEADEIL